MVSVTWINEVSEYAMPIATLSAAPWLMWRNQHVRLDLLGAKLSASVRRFNLTGFPHSSVGLIWSAW